MPVRTYIVLVAKRIELNGNLKCQALPSNINREISTLVCSFRMNVKNNIHEVCSMQPAQHTSFILFFTYIQKLLTNGYPQNSNTETGLAQNNTVYLII